jgi:hypothetical protein
MTITLIEIRAAALVALALVLAVVTLGSMVLSAVA